MSAPDRAAWRAFAVRLSGGAGIASDGAPGSSSDHGLWLTRTVARKGVARAGPVLRIDELS